MNAVILLSGGQDSTTCLYWAKKEFDKIYAIGFDYGQMHIKEIEQAKKIALKFAINTLRNPKASRAHKLLALKIYKNVKNIEDGPFFQKLYELKV